MNQLSLTEELEKSEPDFTNIKSALQHLDDLESIFVVLTRDGRIAYINEAGCEVLNSTYAGAVGKNWFYNFIPEDKRETIINTFNELMAGNIEPFNRYSNTVLATDGSEILISWDNSLLKGSDKSTVVGSFSLGKEISSAVDIDSYLSICAYCKNIRNPENEKWEILEKYLHDNYDLDFSHGICEVCLENKEFLKLR